MTLRELLAALDGMRAVECPGGAEPAEYADRPVGAVVCDSRAVRNGDVFVAIPGTRSDGHDFVPAAVETGAAAVVVERTVDLPPRRTVPQVVVADARAALSRLAHARNGFPGRTLSVTGITGTKGKTTTAFLLRSILRAAGRMTGLLGTVEYDLLGRCIPAPLTTPDAAGLADHLAEIRRKGGDSAVMEVSSIALDQGRTAEIDFAAAVFTNLTGDHLDYHGTMEDYLVAKARLFADLAPGRPAVLNADDGAAVKLASRTKGRVIWYSLSAPADVVAESVRVDSTGSRFRLRFAGGEPLAVHSRLVGLHNVSNCLAAAGAAWGLGVEPEVIVEGLQNAPAVPGRLEPVACDRGFAVLVDYAHTDDSLDRVLSALRPLTTGRILTVFGCGGDRDRTKRPRMAAVAERRSDRVIVTSDNPRTERPEDIIAEVVLGISPAGLPKLRVEPDRRAAISAAISEARPGDVVLIAGKGHEDYQIIGTTKLPFDDRLVAAECLGRPAMAAGA